MIDELLNRDNVLRLAREVAARSAAEPEPALESLRSLQAAAKSFATEVPHGGIADAEDREAFLPSDPTLSLLQALYEQALRAGGGVVTARAGVGPLASERLAAVGARPERADRFKDAPGRWALTFIEALVRYGAKRRKFQLPASPPKPFAMAPDARVVLVGDWGTGEWMARNVAARIRAALRDAGGRQTHVIHLGDVYYAGTTWEANDRFLQHWPVYQHEATLHHSWCLNANHDMYAAGEGLFEVILRDRRFAAQVSQDGRPTSEFQLVGKHWQILGLDSAWKLTGSGLDDLRGHAGHVSHGQVQWLTGAASGGPPAILLSHHQPLSRKTAGGGIVREGNLFEQTEAVRRSPGLGAWFWGHEHRCMTYGAREGIGYAACVGHGAIPSAPRASSAQAGEWELTDTWTDAEGKQWRKCGFAILDFSSATTDVQVRYVDHRGRDSKPPECFGVPPGRASPDQGPHAPS